MVSLEEKAIKEANILWKLIEDKIREFQPDLECDKGDIVGLATVVFNEKGLYKCLLLGKLHLDVIIKALRQEVHEIQTKKRKGNVIPVA